LALDGIPILLTDTAGLREAEDKVEAIGVERASRLVEASDVLVWLGEDEMAPSHPRRIDVHAKSDIAALRLPGRIPVSAVTQEGIKDLLQAVAARAKSLLPGEGAVALNRRQASLIDEASRAVGAAAESGDPVLTAEDLRHARAAFDRLTGRAGVEDVLDALFGRFCLGK
jgi:tRNA modification GTPase